MSRLDSGSARAAVTTAQARARYRRILRFASRQLVSLWWYELVLPRFGLRSISDRTRVRRLQRIARRFQRLALELSGLLIKLGQFLSTRLDVLPPEITRELEGLQDTVPAVPFAEIRELAEHDLGVPLETAFVRIDDTPLAAASLGQVHRAVLAVGEGEPERSVVVKIQRPGIDAIVDVDLAALGTVAKWVSRIQLVRRRADVPALLKEFATTSLEEIDYLNEAANAERFAEQFADDPRVRVPEVFWERSSRRVLVLEDVTAIKITDTAGLREAGLDPTAVANDLAGVMFDQVFLRGFFHADPHPGNLFVEAVPSDALGGAPTPRLIFIDFGMMGEVPGSLLRALRTTVIAVASRDGAGMVRGMREVGVLMPAADVVELERALTKVFDRFGGISFVELQQVDPTEYTAFAAEFGDIVRALPFQFPEDLLLVLRSISLTSGVCSAVDPDFNIWNSIEPYAGKLIRAEGGNVLEAAVRNGVSALRLVASLPSRVDALITRAELGQLAVRTPELERRISILTRGVRRLISAVLFGALFLGGLLTSPSDQGLGTTLLVLAALPLAHALFADVIARRGPLP